MKLKTLKELEFESTLEFPSTRYIDEYKGLTTDGKNSEEIYPNEDHLADATDLKQEAIKWIKKMKSDIPKGKTPQHIKDIINGVNGAINIFSKFFNVTEEDLK